MLFMTLMLGLLLSSTVFAADGDLDPTFDSDGIVTTNLSSYDIGRAVAIQSDGKIVVAGQSHNGSDYDFAVARYNSDGSLDTSFSGDGAVTTPIGSSHDSGRAVAIQSDGKIVAAGYSHNGSKNDFAVVRYNNDGSLDTTFDSDGKLSTPIGSGDDYGCAVAIQSDGQIVVAGVSHNGSNWDFAVVRYQSSGNNSSLQTLIDAANPSDTITLYGHFNYAGGVTITKTLTINLNGATVGAGSPAFTITAPDVTIHNGVLDGGGDDSPAILVQDGGDNFTLRDSEVRDWRDGVEVAADVTSFKLTGNYIHDNADAGLQVNSGVAIGGVATIEGNLFKDNTGHGIKNDGDTSLNAEYNSWGDPDGAPVATGGDGIQGDVDANPHTYAELFVEVNPGTSDLTRTVEENQTFTTTVNIAAMGLYGIQYRLLYNTDYLTLNDVADDAFKTATGSCTHNNSVAGILDVFCTRFNPNPDAQGVMRVNQLTFTASGSGLTGFGVNHFDLYHVAAHLDSGARNGTKVYLNNGGFGDPSAAGIRTITDENDGEIMVSVPAGQYAGFIDLQGRTDDQGALLSVYDQSATTGAVLLASATSAADGSYMTAFEGLNKLMLDTTYYLQVDAPLHLPTTAISASNYEHQVPLSTLPITNLDMLVLLGGDATNDNTITLADATCIGSDLGSVTSTCTGSNASSDVNGNGLIDLTDLVLMGGNYDKNASPWTP